MAGSTATIDVTVLRLQWSSHSSMADICSYWTVSRDQLIRLRDVYELPKRHDRRARQKPPRTPPPGSDEERASEESLELAPQIAARVTCVQAMWSDAVREARYWQRPTLLSVPVVEVDIDVDQLEE